MIYRGVVNNGVIQLEGGKTLPDGTQVVVEPLATTSESLGWPEGYFDETFASIADDSFYRPSQGELPDAVDLE